MGLSSAILALELSRFVFSFITCKYRLLQLAISPQFSTQLIKVLIFIADRLSLAYQVSC